MPTQTMPVFADFTDAEEAAVDTIFSRLPELGGNLHRLDRTTLMMDLAATHARCPLDLERLAAFPPFDFLHDIAGITRHMNRQTGELEDCFLPRCAKPQT